jgi:hypothetical protein
MSSFISKTYNNLGYDLRSYGTEQVSRIAPSVDVSGDQGLFEKSSKTTGSRDRVEISPEAKAKAAEQQSSQTGANGLSQEQEQEIAELKSTDSRVRAHEQAHMAAGGNLVKGGVHYEYENGPDGKNYAVGGEVQIDTSPVKNDPEATIIKAERIRNAALAPADPSSQDRSVAASAEQMASQARMELNQSKSQGAGTNSLQYRPIDIKA